jgi:hypothetical protein
MYLFLSKKYKWTRSALIKMPNLIKVVTLDSGIKSDTRNKSIQYMDDVVKRYIIEKNGFRFTFVQEIKTAKMIFDYDKHNPGSSISYSLLLFNPNLVEKTEGELKHFLEQVRENVPVIMCSDRKENYWETINGLVQGVNYDDYFGANLISISEGSGYFLRLENMMNENLKRFYQSKKK